jgi:hypothetical protein
MIVRKETQKNFIYIYIYIYIYITQKTMICENRLVRVVFANDSLKFCENCQP